jgi:hypothetical protein
MDMRLRTTRSAGFTVVEKSDEVISKVFQICKVLDGFRAIFEYKLNLKPDSITCLMIT